MPGCRLFSLAMKRGIQRRLQLNLRITEGQSLELRNGQKLPPARFQTQDQRGERIFMDVGAAFDVLGLNVFPIWALVAYPNTNSRQLSEILPPELTLVKNEQALDLEQLTQSLQPNLTALSFYPLWWVFIVFNAVRFSLVNRRPTVATLRELGVGLTPITLAISAESVLISTLGAGLGLALRHGWGLRCCPLWRRPTKFVRSKPVG